MTISDLASGLNDLKQGLRFVHFGWSPAPDYEYGVYAEDDESYFRANNRHAEKTTIVYVNLYTRDDTGTTSGLVEDYLKDLEDSGALTFSWYLNTIQFEESGYIHYEWVTEFA